MTLREIEAMTAEAEGRKVLDCLGLTHPQEIRLAGAGQRLPRSGKELRAAREAELDAQIEVFSKNYYEALERRCAARGSGK